MDFDWDEDKNEKNKNKHELDFNDAEQIFDDSNQVTVGIENSIDKYGVQKLNISSGNLLDNNDEKALMAAERKIRKDKTPPLKALLMAIDLRITQNTQPNKHKKIRAGFDAFEEVRGIKKRSKAGRHYKEWKPVVEELEARQGLRSRPMRTEVIAAIKAVEENKIPDHYRIVRHILNMRSETCSEIPFGGVEADFVSALSGKT